MKYTLSLLCFLGFSLGLAQTPAGDYLFPINPGQPNYLAGTVGEIRATHIHAGIDIKTGGKIGLAVYAVADGYISRAKVAPGGYGHVLYLKHTGGKTSVYAHLDGFEPTLQQWVIEKQYEKKSFEVDLFPKADQFYFQKGDVIGFSGNSGSSSGPHLHFEIRNENNEPMDVLAFGFNEIQDNLPPVIQKIAFETLQKDARVNGLFGRYEFPLIKKKDTYVNQTPIHLKGEIGIEIYAYDPMNDIYNKNGIIKTTLKVDDAIQFEEMKAPLSFSKQRNTLVHYNYAARQKGSRRFSRLYLADGNEQNFYATTNRGVRFTDQKNIAITSVDSYKNTSLARILLADTAPAFDPKRPEMEKIGNFLHFKSNQPVSVKLIEWQSLVPYQQTEKEAYYIWDLREGPPSEVFINGKTKPTHLVSTLPSAQGITYVQDEFELKLTHRSLFDTLYLAFQKKYDTSQHTEFFHFQNEAQPIRAPIRLTLNPKHLYSENTSVYKVNKGGYQFVGGKWEDTSITFSTRDFGKYTLLSDSVPPRIIPKMVNRDHIRLKIQDDLSGIKSYKAQLNGAFLLMYYDPKKNLIWSQKRKKNIPFDGEFSIEVIDHLDNKKTYTKTL